MTDDHSRSGVSLVLAHLLFLALAALVLRLVHLDHTPIYDELYHVLAAKSFLEDGDLCIAECTRPYTRGFLFTYLVAGIMKLGGASLVTARATSVLIGTLWVLAIYLWTARVTTRTAGLSAGLLMAVAPGAIYLSQMARFYPLHGLLIWIGAGLLYLAVAGRDAPVKRVAMALAGMIAFLLARQMQISTLIPLTAVGVWAAGYWIWRLWTGRSGGKTWFMTLLGLSVASAVALLLFVGLQGGTLDSLMATYRWTTQWTLEDQNNVRFMHDWLLGNYGLLYSLFPAACILAAARYRAVAGFCATVVACAFIAHSLAGFKAVRVFYYYLPFFFAIWGMAVSVLLPALWTACLQAVGHLHLRFGARARFALASTLVSVALLAVLGTTPAWNTTLKLITHTDENWPASKPFYRGKPNWETVLPTIAEQAESAEVVLSSDALVAYFYLGRVDAAVSANQLYDDMPPGQRAPEFRIDWRGGWPVIATAESVARVMQCYAPGILIVDAGALDNPAGLAEAASDLVRRRMESIPLDPRGKLRLFRWTERLDAIEPCVPPPIPKRVPSVG